MIPSISVISPIYNMERLLSKCIDSILAQTFNDFELILIDDGSTDRSGVICDEYATRDSRIKVIHKKNEGVSIARQLGIDFAQGEYTIHIDPDDWVEPKMLEELYKKAKSEHADMVICDYYVTGMTISITRCRSLPHLMRKPYCMTYSGGCMPIVGIS